MFMGLGRIQAWHPQVADLYEMAVKDSREGARLVWRQKPEQQQWLEAREGAYLLRTNLTADGAADLWKKYMQLTEVEAAFRTLKSELAIRPLFHQLERRVKAHVLVAFLGYALLVRLKHLLKRGGAECSPAHVLKRLAELYSVDIVLPPSKDQRSGCGASPSSMTSGKKFFTNSNCRCRSDASQLRS
jgi:hypothetical protein